VGFDLLVLAHRQKGSDNEHLLQVYLVATQLKIFDSDEDVGGVLFEVGDGFENE
jgi:hypothetical protein